MRSYEKANTCGQLKKNFTDFFIFYFLFSLIKRLFGTYLGIFIG